MDCPIVLFVFPLAKEIVDTVARGGILGAWTACHPSHWRYAKKAQSCGILFDQMLIEYHMEMHLVSYCSMYHVIRLQVPAWQGDLESIRVCLTLCLFVSLINFLIESCMYSIYIKLMLFCFNNLCFWITTSPSAPEAEITAWLDENGFACATCTQRNRRWLALDDLPLEFPTDHVVQTDPLVGPLGYDIRSNTRVVTCDWCQLVIFGAC